MFTKAYRIVNDYEQAQDVLQEAFVEVFRDMRSYRQEASLGSWIKTIVIRKALRQLQLERRFEPFEEGRHDQVVEWQDNLTGEYLDQAIRSLPPGCRAVFLLIEVEGYSHREAAALLGISEGTSKSQLHHAKKLLQKILNELYRSW
ncbi:sigma-70 family RNA polymerase sigma factor [soil metagenome]